jgi:RNA recognition motif-containing protein
MISAWNRFRIIPVQAQKHPQLYWRYGISAAVTVARRYILIDDTVHFTPTENSVFIGNITPDVTEQDLRTLVQRFGTVRDCHLIKTRGTSELRMAYVDFAETVNAKAAINRLNNLHFHKHVLKVKPFQQQKESEISVTVMIEGILPETEPKSLREHMERVGHVRSVRLYTKNNINNSNNNSNNQANNKNNNKHDHLYGVCLFRNMESARLAEKYLHNSKLHGASIRVRSMAEEDKQLIQDDILKPVPELEPEDALVYVGNLNRHIDWWSIHNILMQAGLVRSLNIYETVDKQQVFGIALYSRVSAAQRAVDMLNNKPDGISMKVKRLNQQEHESITKAAALLEKSGEKRRNNSFLFVGNLAHYTTPLRLRAHLSQVGILRNLKVAKNMWKQTIAYVRYKSPHSQRRAVQELHRSVLDHNRIQIIPQVTTYRLDEGHGDWDEWWIVVEKVDPKATHLDLHRLAQTAGRVKSCSIFKNHFGEVFGIVRYQSRRGRDRALQVLPNALLLNSPIHVRAPDLELNDLYNSINTAGENTSNQGSTQQNHDKPNRDGMAQDNDENDDKEIKMSS